MEDYQSILKRKQEHYGNTEASYELSAEEFATNYHNEKRVNYDCLDYEDFTIQVGKSYHIYASETSRLTKVHIMFILDGFYDEQKIIIYRFYGKYKKWWHQCICTDSNFKFNYEMGQEIKNRKK